MREASPHGNMGRGLFFPKEKQAGNCREKRSLYAGTEHIAIILDGNGRWAKSKGMPRSYGHVKGCENLENICNTARDLGVKYLTVYAFSTENWKRSPEEVNGLMNLFRRYLKRCMKQAKKNNMKVTVIGDPTAFDQDIQDKIRELEEFSRDFDAIHFQIALNYGSRDELVRAANRMSADIRKRKGAGSDHRAGL